MKTSQADIARLREETSAAETSFQALLIYFGSDKSTSPAEFFRIPIVFSAQLQVRLSFLSAGIARAELRNRAESPEGGSAGTAKCEIRKIRCA